MANNIEIKASVPDRKALERNARAIADQRPFEIRQEDTFFNCPNGRLKLREFGDGQAQLIFYQRADQAGPKNSFYQIVEVTQAGAMREALHTAYGICGRVIKDRTLYLAGRTRIHIDRVEGLGNFMELEVVLGDGENTQAGEIEALELMQKLGVSVDHLITVAYADLLLAKTASSTHTRSSQAPNREAPNGEAPDSGLSHQLFI